MARAFGLTGRMARGIIEDLLRRFLYLGRVEQMNRKKKINEILRARAKKASAKLAPEAESQQPAVTAEE